MTTTDILNFPTQKFDVILADPPWSYKDKCNSGNRGASFKYPTQDPDWIKNLPVQTISKDNCMLFLWVTMPQLPIGLDVMKAWSFEYKTCAFTWVKRNKVADSWFFGMGSYTRSNAELCLLGVKGKPKRVDAGVPSIVDDRILKHSQKPVTVHERIERLMGDVDRVELFARNTRPNWTCWGNEIVPF